MNTDQKNGSELSCDYLVIGGGVSGMTMSLLLARSGADVILLERSDHIGGSMQRFCRNGIPFDTGFHFTTTMNSAFGDMFRYLGMSDHIRTKTVRKQLYLAEEDRMYDIPQGHKNLIGYYSSIFPEYREQIIRFYETEENIYRDTPMFAQTDREYMLCSELKYRKEEHIVLQDYINTLHIPANLATLLCSFAVCCCGTPAEELSLASHARISYGLDDHLVRFIGGGDAFIHEFKRLAADLKIRIFTGDSIREFHPSKDSRRTEAHEAVTRNGRKISFQNCIFTIHPQSILTAIEPLLKNDLLRQRMEEFEESCGFFSLWGKLADDVTITDDILVSYLRKTELPTLMSPKDPGNTATGVLLVNETDLQGNPCRTVTVFEQVFPEETDEWKDTVSGKRGESYAVYKQRKQKSLEEKIYKVKPELKGKIDFVASASQLTYRDYLSPFGSGYGIRQKIEQSNLFGRLPVRNFYVIGQNSLLPGAFGAMQSAFILWQKLVKS